MSFSTTILTYHSQNIGGQSTSDNDHVALEHDLEALHASGAKIIPLGELVDQLDGNGCDEGVSGAVCLTFDDGCDFDVRDLDYPGFGIQRSFMGILQDFTKKHGKGAQPGLHATSFVIASDEARRIIDTRSLFGKGWISDGWWRELSADLPSGLSSVKNRWCRRRNLSSTKRVPGPACLPTLLVNPVNTSGTAFSRMPGQNTAAGLRLVPMQVK